MEPILSISGDAIVVLSGLALLIALAGGALLWRLRARRRSGHATPIIPVARIGAAGSQEMTRSQDHPGPAHPEKVASPENPPRAARCRDRGALRRCSDPA